MKNKIIPFKTAICVMAFFTLLSSGCQSNGNQICSSADDLTKYQLVTPASRITVRGEGKIVNDRNSYFTAWFDEGGRVKRVQYYFPDGKKSKNDLYFYENEFGLLSETRSYTPDGEQTGIYNYEYDMFGEMTRCWLMGMSSEELYDWRHTVQDGKTVKTQTFCEGELQTTSINDWNDNCRVERVYDKDSVLICTNTYNYLCKDKPLSIESEDNDVHIRISYNEQGLPVMSVGVQISPEGSFYWDGESDEHTAHEYVYEYDKKGNWTARTELNAKTGEVISILTRKIRY